MGLLIHAHKVFQMGLSLDIKKAFLMVDQTVS